MLIVSVVLALNQLSISLGTACGWGIAVLVFGYFTDKETLPFCHALFALQLRLLLGVSDGHPPKF